MNLIPFFVPLDLGSSIAGAADAMMQPIYWVISGLVVGFHTLFSNFLNPNAGLTWVLSIISLTIVVRTAMIPLFVKQINSSRKMQLLGPKMKALQEKYGTDRERLGQEQMKLYKDEGVNPFASCMPLIVQMPIFIGLFNVLNGVSHGAAVGHWFVQNPELVASLRDANFLGASLAGMFMPMFPWGPNQWMAGVLILGLTLSLFFTQLHMMRKNMPPEALTGPMAQQQKTMLYVLPFTYLLFGISVPIGVMVYWMASNLWTLGQQYILIHNSPSPGTPAYIDWEERMRAKGEDPEALIRKRLGMDNRPKATVSDDPTKVARQSSVKKRDTSAAASTNDVERQRIQRQQPNRGSRASRKKS